MEWKWLGRVLCPAVQFSSILMAPNLEWTWPRFYALSSYLLPFPACLQLQTYHPHLVNKAVFALSMMHFFFFFLLMYSWDLSFVQRMPLSKNLCSREGGCNILSVCSPLVKFSIYREQWQMVQKFEQVWVWWHWWCRPWGSG